MGQSLRSACQPLGDANNATFLLVKEVFQFLLPLVESCGTDWVTVGKWLPRAGAARSAAFAHCTALEFVPSLQFLSLPLASGARHRSGVLSSVMFYYEKRGPAVSCITSAGSRGSRGHVGSFWVPRLSLGGRGSTLGRPVATSTPLIPTSRDTGTLHGWFSQVSLPN